MAEENREISIVKRRSTVGDIAALSFFLEKVDQLGLGWQNNKGREVHRIQMDELHAHFYC